jgi:hypothetical protein
MIGTKLLNLPVVFLEEIPLYYDKEGHPITVGEWTALMGNREYCRIGYDKDADGNTISTVWLGLEHGRDKRGRPLIFETMVFPKDGGDEECYRFSRHVDAVLKHAVLKNRLSTKEKKESSRFERLDTNE